MAARKNGIAARLIAPLTPDSPDLDARDDANNPALMAELAASKRRADEAGGAVPLEELNRRRPLTPQEIAEAEAALDAFEEEARAAADGPNGRGPRGRRPSTVNGKVLLRLPLSVHRELIERAAAEQTSLNQLVLAYVSRGLGQDAERRAS